MSTTSLPPSKVRSLPSKPREKIFCLRDVPAISLGFPRLLGVFKKFVLFLPFGPKSSCLNMIASHVHLVFSGWMATPNSLREDWNTLDWGGGGNGSVTA